ncbi:hypothetical protein HMPREF9005_0909, partial [Actinomyces sp. oral taxon 178 str. F0338]
PGFEQERHAGGARVLQDGARVERVAPVVARANQGDDLGCGALRRAIVGGAVGGGRQGRPMRRDGGQGGRGCLAVGQDGSRIRPRGGGIAPRSGLRIGQGTGAQAPRIGCGWPQLVAGPSEQAPHRVRHPRGGPLHEGIGTPLGARLGDQGRLHPSDRGESVGGDRFCGAHALHARTPGADRGFGGRRRPAGALMPSMLAYPERSGARRRSLEGTDPAALGQATGHWGRQLCIGVGNRAIETAHWGRQRVIGVGNRAIETTHWSRQRVIGVGNRASETAHWSRQQAIGAGNRPPGQAICLPQ